jgi:peptide subunit release factor 1 (eRF1)
MVASTDINHVPTVSDIHGGGEAARGDLKDHAEEHRRMKLDQVVDRLVYLFDREPCRVVVSGPHEVACAFVERLPKRVAPKVRTIPNLKGADLKQVVLEQVAQLLDYAQLGEVVELEERIYQEAQAGRMGALGAQDVLLALQEGRVHELLLTRSFDAKGSLCQTCGALDVRASVACHYCGSQVEVGSLRDAIVEKALRSAARVRIVPDHPRHRMVGGIAALLRPNHTAAGLPSVGYAEEGSSPTLVPMGRHVGNEA